MQQRSLADGVWSPKWTPIGRTRLQGAPAAVGGADGAVVLAGVGGGKTLMTATGTPGGTGAVDGALSWGDWTPVPGVGDVGPGVALTTDPATSGFTAYVERATDQNVLALGYAGQAWATPVQTPLSGVPTAATSGNGTPYVFVRGPSGGVRVVSGTSGQAVSSGVDTALPPAAAATPEGKILLVTAISPNRLRVSSAG